MAESVGQIGLDLVVNKNQFEGQMAGIQGMAKKAGLALAAAFSVKKIVDFGKSAIDLGSQLAEVDNVIQQAVPSMEKQIDSFAKSAIEKFGMSETSAKRFTGVFASMARGFGYSEKSAAAMGTTLTGLAADVASFYDTSQQEAFTKLKSIFTGETETLKDLGIVMTQTALDAYAMANGYGKTTKAMSEAEKVALRYAFVQEKLKFAQGDFARTSGSWANQVRILSEQFNALKATIGQGLINVFTPVIQVINTIIGKLMSLANAFKAFTEMLSGNKGSGGGGAAAKAAAEIGAVTDAADEASGAIGGTGGAAKKAAKDIKGMTTGIDELNIIDPKTDSGSGSGGGAGDYNPDEFDMGALDTSGVDNFAKNMTENLEKFKNLLEPTRKALEDLYNNGLKKLSEFTWGTLKDFWNNFLKPVGLWTLSDQGLPRFLNITNALLTEVNWGRLRESLAGLYTELERLTVLYLTNLLNFYESFLKPVAVWTLGEALPRLVDVFVNLSKGINWENLVSALKDVYEVLAKLTIGIGEGLIAFVETLAKVLTPFISAAIDALALALKGIAALLDKLPPAVLEAIGFAIGGIATAFMAFEAYKGIVGILEGLKTGLAGLTAIASNPIVLVGAAIGGLAYAIHEMNEAWDKRMAEEFADFQQKIGSNTGELNNAAKALDDVAASSKEMIKTAEQDAKKVDNLTQAYFDLADQSELTAEEQEKLKEYAKQLVDVAPELQGMIDMTTGRYTAQKNELEKVIQKQQEYQELLLYKEIVDKYTTALSEANIQLEVSEKLYKTNSEKVELLKDSMDKLVDSGLDPHVWFDQNKKSLEDFNFAIDESTDVSGVLAQAISFYEKELGISAEAQDKARRSLEEANLSYDIATATLDDHKEKYKELQDEINETNFAQISLKATEEIDRLGGVFVDGKQVVGKEAVEMYQAILDGWGDTGLEMYNLGEDTVAQFGQGGKNGVPEAVSTMTDGLWREIEAGYRDQGYQVSYDGGVLLAKAIGDGGAAEGANAANAITDSITSGIANEDNTGKLIESGKQGASKVIEGGKSLDQEMKTLGSGWAAFTNEGLEQKFAELQSSSTPKAIQNWAQIGIINPFTGLLDIHSPSGVFTRFGSNIVEGLNSGIANNQESSKGIISTWVSKLTNWFTGLLDIHSPSGIFSEFGLFTVDGFNQGVSDHSESTNNVMGGWISSLSSVVNTKVSELQNQMVTKFSDMQRTVSNTWSNISNDTSTTWDSMKSNTSQSISAIADNLRIKHAEIKNSWETNWTNTKIFSKSTWETMKLNANTIFTDMKTFLNQMTDDTKSSWEEKWNLIKEYSDETWNSIKDKSTEIFEAIRDKLSEIWDAVKQTIEEKWNAIKEWFGEIWQKIKDVFNLDEMTQIGSNMMNNFWNGMRSVWSEIVSWLDGICDTVGNVFDTEISKAKNKVKKAQKESDEESGDDGEYVNSGPGVKGHSTGGFPESGSMYIAHEDGESELIGSWGGKAAVANNMQITEGITRAVQNGMRSCLAPLVSTMSNLVSNATPPLAMVGSVGAGRTDDSKLSDMISRAVAINQGGNMSDQYLSTMVDLLRKIIEIIEAMDLVVNIDIRELRKKLKDLENRSGYSFT